MSREVFANAADETRSVPTEISLALCAFSYLEVLEFEGMDGAGRRGLE